MRLTERQRYADLIAEVTKNLPADLPLKDRKAAVARARPYSVGQTANAEKSWQAARRDYLTPFGYQPMTKRAKEHRDARLPLFDQPVSN